MRFVYLAFLALTGLLGLMAGPSYAQAARTWVSGVGDDANPCSRTAPCKTFAGAISKTAAGGEINTIDPGGYGTVTITKSITIRSELEAGVVASSTTGIIVNAAATDKIVLQGLDIDGGPPTAPGVNGIRVLQAGSVYILNCNIRNFPSAAPNGNGVIINNTSNTIRVFMKDSYILNGRGGVLVSSTSPGTASIAIADSLIDGNTDYALSVAAAGNSAALIRSVLSGSPSGIVNAGGTVNAFGPSNVITGAGAPTTFTTFK